MRARDGTRRVIWERRYFGDNEIFGWGVEAGFLFLFAGSHVEPVAGCKKAPRLLGKGGGLSLFGPWRQNGLILCMFG